MCSHRSRAPRLGHSNGTETDCIAGSLVRFPQYIGDHTNSLGRHSSSHRLPNPYSRILQCPRSQQYWRIICSAPTSTGVASRRLDCVSSLVSDLCSLVEEARDMLNSFVLHRFAGKSYHPPQITSQHGIQGRCTAGLYSRRTSILRPEFQR